MADIHTVVAVVADIVLAVHLVQCLEQLEHLEWQPVDVDYMVSVVVTLVDFVLDNLPDNFDNYRRRLVVEERLADLEYY